MWDLRGDWEQQIDLGRRVSSWAIELSALSEEEAIPLLEFLSTAGELPFKFMSVHGPSKNRELPEDQLVDLLLQLADFCDGIVMHPDTMGELEPFRRLGPSLLVENLDARKSWGGTVGDLARVFADLPEARFCFDVAHAWSLDPSMDLANELLDAFAPRLSHVHLSSLDEGLHHVSLTVEDEALFAPTLARCIDVPWILEAPPPVLKD